MTETDWKKKYEDEHKRRCDLESRFDHRISDKEPAKEVHGFMGTHPGQLNVGKMLAAFERFYLWAQAIDAQREHYRNAFFYAVGCLGADNPDDAERLAVEVNQAHCSDDYPSFPALTQRDWLLKAVESLWQILDNIDTAGDVAKGNDKTYRAIIEKEHPKRSKWFESLDGYTLTSVGAPTVIQIGGEIRDGIGEPQSPEGPPDVSVTVDIMALASWFVPPELVDKWTNEEREAACAWAGAIHMFASDNDDVVVPLKPEHVTRDGRDIGWPDSPEWEEALAMTKAWDEANNAG